MKTLLTLLVPLLMTLPAHALTLDCRGAFATQGVIRLQCDANSCVINGSASETNLRVSANFNNCTSQRRSETNAEMYKTQAYYDLRGGQCWANYVRVSKTLAPDGTMNASLVQAGGGDKHDYSGYQYMYFSCKPL